MINYYNVCTKTVSKTIESQSSAGNWRLRTVHNDALPNHNTDLRRRVLYNVKRKPFTRRKQARTWSHKNSEDMNFITRNGTISENVVTMQHNVLIDYRPVFIFLSTLNCRATNCMGLTCKLNHTKTFLYWQLQLRERERERERAVNTVKYCHSDTLIIILSQGGYFSSSLAMTYTSKYRPNKIIELRLTYIGYIYSSLMIIAVTALVPTQIGFI